jgi:hypothetical protein
MVIYYELGGTFWEIHNLFNILHRILLEIPGTVMKYLGRVVGVGSKR